MTIEAGQRTYHVVSHTHWDREWYQPFEAFRARLVRMMDDLIALLETDPNFKHFVMDGQTIPLDDYLEIRPDRRETVEHLVSEGRLLAGPNYILPDEFLIGAESWVRNLMIGIRSARGYGRVISVGYSPDAFGHIAHLPAILRGFGLNSVVIWRGVSNDVKKSEFRWAAPDGSEVLALHLPHGYGFLAALPEEEENLRNVLGSMRVALDGYATTSNVLVPNGTDHLPAHRGLSGVIASANRMLEGASMVHSTYEEFAAAVRTELGGGYEDLPLYAGEFRSSDRSHVLAGVLSARMWLKQRYAACENLLAGYAEPLVAWAHLLRRDTGASAERTRSDRALLQHAWRLLLQNGPHDSVTGCSVDPVYDDVGLRFQKVDQIASSIAYNAHRQIADAVAQPGQETVVAWNGEHGPRTDICTFQAPATEERWPMRVVDAAGIESPLQVVRRGLHSPRDRRERVECAFVARDLPGFGYRSYRIEFAPKAEEEAAAHGAAIANEFFRVSAEDDGTLTIEDVRSGRVLRGLNRFADSGDGGDEYTYCPPAADEVVNRPALQPRISVTESGPVRWTLEVRQTYSVPARLAESREARSTERVDCEIMSRVELYPGVARVEVESEIDNRAQDHRLRVLFPSGVFTSHSASEQHFGVIARPVEVPEDGGGPERPVGTYPQKAFTDLSDGESGLMIANRGLPEYEVITEADGTVTLALTLLRCVSWLSRGDLKTRPGHAGPEFETPGAQMPGRWTFEYAIIPHEGEWPGVFAEAHRFARPLRAVRVTGGTGDMPAEGALISIDRHEMIASAIKLAEDDDSLVVRVYNMGHLPEGVNVRLRERHTDAALTDLNEENPSPTVTQGGSVRLSLTPNQISTLKFAT